MNEKGAAGDDSLYFDESHSIAMINTLLGCGLDPTKQYSDGNTPLMRFSDTHYRAEPDCNKVARLLQDPRVRASINVQNACGDTALHYACRGVLHYTPLQEHARCIIMLLLQSEAALSSIRNDRGQTPVMSLLTRPTHRPTLALLKDIKKAEWSSLIVKARRIVNAPVKTPPPFFVQDREARGQPLPEVAISTRSKKLRIRLSFLVGIDGKMPPEVFRLVMDFLMPWWDPLRRNVPGLEGGTGQPRKDFTRSSSVNKSSVNKSPRPPKLYHTRSKSTK